MQNSTKDLFFKIKFNFALVNGKIWMNEKYQLFIIFLNNLGTNILILTYS